MLDAGSGAEHDRLLAARGREHGDPLGREAAGRERERLDRRLVDPLRVVDRDEHRCGLGEVSEQGEHRDPHCEQVRGLGVLRQRAQQRLVLGRRKRVELVLDRSQQLGEPGVGERGFALDAVHRELGEAGGAVAPVSEQGRLADPGFAPEDERSARSGPGIGEHAIDAVALRPATYEHGVERTRHLGSRHPKTW